MSLNYEEKSYDDVEATEAVLRGEDVTIVFSLPDGQRHRHTVRRFCNVFCSKSCKVRDGSSR